MYPIAQRAFRSAGCKSWPAPCLTCQHRRERHQPRLCMPCQLHTCTLHHDRHGLTQLLLQICWSVQRLRCHEGARAESGWGHTPARTWQRWLRGHSVDTFTYAATGDTHTDAHVIVIQFSSQWHGVAGDQVNSAHHNMHESLPPSELPMQTCMIAALQAKLAVLVGKHSPPTWLLVAIT